MKKNILFLGVFFIFFNVSFSFGQNSVNKYIIYSDKADSLHLRGDAEHAISFYNLAINNNNGVAKVKHRYALASCYADVDKIDSAFSQLKIIAEKGKFSSYDLISLDKAFFSMHLDKRWLPLMKVVKSNLNSKN